MLGKLFAKAAEAAVTSVVAANAPKIIKGAKKYAPLVGRAAKDTASAVKAKFDK